MNKRYSNFVLIILLIVFFFLFRFNATIKRCVLDAISAWLNNLVPFMFPMYLIVDLLLNYGLANWMYKIFKSNSAILILIGLLLGCPSNAKYISDFYKNGYISRENANWLLTFAYSPNPLFIIGIAPNITLAIRTLLFLYITNFLISFLFARIKDKDNNPPKLMMQKPFTEVLESSIYKSFKVLVLILGIVIVYAIVNTLLGSILPGDNLLLKSFLEITNALSAMRDISNYKWFMLACAFGGLSIHTQIKSILEDTPLDYKYFLYGRLIASALAFVFAFVF